jgi:putative membrane protein
MLAKLTILLGLFLIASTSGASAHAVADDAQTSTILRLLETVVIVAAVLLYARGVIRIRRDVGPDRVVSRSQTVAFGLAMSLFVLILSPPVDEITDALFSAHMAQHLVLILFIPPLLVWSRPVLVAVWGLPRRWRKDFATAGFVHWLRSTVYWVMEPLIVAILFLGAFCFWHLPRPYAWALSNEWLHTVEHLSFLVTAIMFWTLVIEPSGRRRMGYIPTMLFVAAIAVLSGLPGALMLLSPATLFAAHGHASAAWGLTALEDQQIAGVIMWVPAGIFFLVPIAWLFVKAMQPAGQRRAVVHAISILLAVCLLPAMSLTGCSEPKSEADTSSNQTVARGKALIGKYGCGTCHTIPGIDNATGRVGPPLSGVADRVFIAGMLQNNTENLTKWIRDPQSVVPGNAMPAMGVKPDEARTIAAYLETLHDEK